MGTIPFGYCLASDGRRLVPNLHEQQAIRLILALRAGGLSLRAVTAECRRRGVLSRVGRPLGLVQVERIIKRAGTLDDRSATS